jgi:cytochrome c-type biogenesis protein CcmH
MKIWYRGLLSLLFTALAPLALAVIETYEFSSPELEARYHALSQELRCPKCQNQNIADSNAPISEDLRRLLYRQLEAGATDAEILDDMVDRYGEFVRYRPGFDSRTAILWLAPAIFLLIGIALAIAILRGRGSRDLPPLDEGERARLETLLNEHSGDRT